jgi:hypothetical protein
MVIGVKLKVGVMEAEPATEVQLKEEIDSDTCKFNARPMPAPATAIGAGKFTTGVKGYA